MDKPVISSDFTIDDIHKIREYNYEITKDMSENERNDYYDEKANRVRMKLKNHSINDKQLITI